MSASVDAPHACAVAHTTTTATNNKSNGSAASASSSLAKEVPVSSGRPQRRVPPPSTSHTSAQTPRTSSLDGGDVPAEVTRFISECRNLCSNATNKESTTSAQALLERIGIIFNQYSHIKSHHPTFKDVVKPLVLEVDGLRRSARQQVASPIVNPTPIPASPAKEVPLPNDDAPLTPRNEQQQDPFTPSGDEPKGPTTSTITNTSTSSTPDHTPLMPTIPSVLVTMRRGRKTAQPLPKIPGQTLEGILRNGIHRTPNPYIHLIAHPPPGLLGDYLSSIWAKLVIAIEQTLQKKIQSLSYLNGKYRLNFLPTQTPADKSISVLVEGYRYDFATTTKTLRAINPGSVLLLTDRIHFTPTAPQEKGKITWRILGYHMCDRCGAQNHDVNLCPFTSAEQRMQLAASSKQRSRRQRKRRRPPLTTIKPPDHD
ncbi:hypothetical protein Pelo_8255 [Pelomyxa schiedti]|nr:hypothetical protein Pelo_8255 [Pelomyxa schiedti]